MIKIKQNKYQKALRVNYLPMFVNYFLLALVGTVTLYPIMNVLAISLSSYQSYLSSPAMVFPRNITLDAYKAIFYSPLIYTSYLNTIKVTVIGTLFNLTMTTLTAYPLSKNKIKGSRFILFLISFTLMFGGGMIPRYLLVRELRLLDTHWALIFPTAITTTNFVIIKNSFDSIPDSLEESAQIDGASALYILWNIVVPLSKPILATMTLFYAVSNWNRLFDAVMFINTRSNWTLPILLKEMITDNNDLITDPSVVINVLPKTMQSATIMVTILPILAAYPFLQRYFITGLMTGAVKG